MAQYTPFTATGDGTTTAYTIAFDYIDTADVKARVNNVVVTNFTVVGSTVTFTTAPPNGQSVEIFRETDNSTIQADFQSGSALRAVDLNDNFLQFQYVTQESKVVSDDASADSTTALTNANSAVVTANTAASDAAAAVSTANTASTNATTALNTANTADTNASAAVTTANNATATANTAASDAASAVTTANTAASDAAAAVTTANTASTNASAAVTTANTAASDATSAVSTANTASTNATTALNTANTASTNATTALNTANTAATDAANAVTTANTASTNASTALSTANTASSTATTASTDASAAVTTANTASATANAAAATVASAVFYTPVANFASFPSNPSNSDRIEVSDSTGLESQSIIAGIPSGFTGSSDLTMRLEYNSSTSKWEFKQYFAEDPEARYMPKQGGTMTGLLTLSGAPTANLHAATKAYVDSANATQDSTITANTAGIATNTTAVGTKMATAGGTFTGAVNFDDDAIIRGDSTNGSGEITLNCEINTHGVNIKGPPHSAAANYTFTLPDDMGSSGQFLQTDGASATSFATPPVATQSTSGYLSAADKAKIDQGNFSNKADLVGGVVPATQIPSVAITEYKGTVANQTAMLAVTGEKGDWVIRSDDSKVYVITGTNPTQASDWTALEYPVPADTNLSYTASTRELASSTGSNTTLPEVVAAGDSGLMTGADKTKLNGIETGATADQTAAEILTAIKSVDGSGSGLDADTLDGVHASSLVSTTNQTSLNSDSRNTRGVTRLYRRDNNSDYSVQTYWDGSRWILYGYNGDTSHAACRVGYADSAGSASSSSTVTVNYNNNSNSTYQMLWGSGNSVYGTGGIYCNPSSNAFYAQGWHYTTGSNGFYNSTYAGGWHMQDTTWYRIYNNKKLYVNNDIAASGNVTAYYSDIRLKEKLGDITNALDKVCSIDTLLYKHNDLAKSYGYEGDRQQIGVSAQSVKKVCPEVIDRAPFDIETHETDGTQTSKSGEDYMTVNYGRLVPLLIESIKELKTEIDQLKSESEAN